MPQLDLANLALRVLFLIGTAAVGYGCKPLNIVPRHLSDLLVYVIAPTAIFTAVLAAPVDRAYWGFTLLGWCFGSGMCLLTLNIARLKWKDSTPNLLAFSAGTGNTGYFGLPLALALLDAHGVAVVVFMILGLNLYEFSVGYYVAARGGLSWQESLNKIKKMPLLYAFALAFVLRLVRDHWGVHLPEVWLQGLQNFKGAYSVLGMMVIGLTLSSTHFKPPSWQVALFAMCSKQVLVPMTAMLGLTLLGIHDPSTCMALLLLSCAPLAANSVVVANQLNLMPQETAALVTASTVITVVTVPCTLMLGQWWLGLG